MSIGIRRLRKTRSTVLAAIISMLLSGCNSNRLSTKPSIEFTEVPLADPGGPVQMGLIGGRATHARPDESIVIYAHSGILWIQPFATESFTKLQPDATWRNAVPRLPAESMNRVVRRRM